MRYARERALVLSLTLALPALPLLGRGLSSRLRVHGLSSPTSFLLVLGDQQLRKSVLPSVHTHRPGVRVGACPGHSAELCMGLL